MIIYWSFKPRKSPYGGANSFLGSLQREMSKRGVHFTTELHKADIAFVNALTHESKGNNLKMKHIEEIAQCQISIIHRKTGFWGRSSPAFHGLNNDGIVVGDVLQLRFSNYVDYHIFQSRYSYNEFVKAGFEGDNYTIIHNGVDCNIFNFSTKRFGSVHSKSIWHEGQKFKIAISSWSNNYNKGFCHYKLLDDTLDEMPDVEVNLVGRIPHDLILRNIKVYKPLRHKLLADFLRRNHVIVQCSINDTCSNALIEGLCCGLPAIYLDSGANAELAAEYGVPYSGNWVKDIGQLKSKCHTFVNRLKMLPYSIEKAADKYLEVFQKVIKR